MTTFFWHLRHAGHVRFKARRDVRRLAIALVVSAGSLCIGTAGRASEGDDPIAKIKQHVAAGEFASARAVSRSLTGTRREQALSIIAGQLAGSGQTMSALGDLQQVQDSQLVQSTLAPLRTGAILGANAKGSVTFSSGDPISFSGQNNNTYNLPSSDAAKENYGLEPLAPQGAGGQGAGGQGGAALADFSQLMNLIQTTIAPDQWDALGGPSTMFPYPGGIYVDPQGLVRDVEVAPSDRLRSLNNLANEVHAAANTSNRDWTLASDLRTVSLKRLRNEYLRLAATGQQPSLELQNLAGISEVRYVIIEDDDILLCGEVGGINEAASPWPQDAKTHQTALGFELLVASAQAVATQSAYGCSIDPTPEGMLAAAQVSNDISSRKIPAALAAEALAAALGEQQIVLFDVPADQPLAWLLVEADRHMKQLALGRHPMPNGLSNYLDVVERAAKQANGSAVPSGQLLRMWFAVQPKEVRKASDSLTFQLAGSPIKLITAKEFDDQQGGRIRAGEDPLGKEFASAFNDHFATIAATYPVYDRLRGAFELTAALQLVQRQVGREKFTQLVGELAVPELMLDTTVSVPTSCESLAVHHTIRTPKKRHDIYIVSGGVKVDPAQSLASNITNYPVLNDLEINSQDAPIQTMRWWWDR